MSGYTANPRNQWYDRNPTQIWKFFNGSAGPHIATQRWSYTVPTLKKFMLQQINQSMMRSVVGAPVGVFDNIVYYTPSNGTIGNFSTLNSLDNTLTRSQNALIGGSTIMLSGDVLQGYTSDASTGGTVDYHNNIQGLEFDA